MQSRTSALLIAALLLLNPSAVFSQVIAEFLPASPGFAAFSGGTRIDGQTFTVMSGGIIGLVSISAQKLGAAPTSVTFQIRSLSGGLPTSTILSSVTVSGSSMAASLGIFSADFSGQNFSVLSGETYALTVSATSSFGLGGVSSAYSGGSHVTSTNSGTTFINFTPAQDLSFSITAAAIPEPGTISLFAGMLGLGIAGWARFQRALKISSR